MPSASQNNSYEYIVSKINSLKEVYPSLRSKPNDYVFSALCVKANFFKNPALNLQENDFADIIVDGQYDGGVDVLLSDPNSDDSDLVIGQSKFYRTISKEDIQNALLKMALFYKDMVSGHFEQVNTTVQGRFLSLNAETGDESTIHFVLYTSAEQRGIRRDILERKLKEQFPDISAKIEVSILFASDIESEIKESESRRPTVESGKINLDERNNYLLYGDSAAIVNASAFSIKQLYAQHNINLLARNLRYHIAGRDIDRAIAETIDNDPESFWLRNNGITIICDDFDIDGREVKLKNFSIVNGGQTTYMLHKNPHINESHDLFLPCKIIKIIGETEDEKNAFSLEIAKATNTQKPIKPVDLKANSPEQVRFAQAMREAGIFYQTKRGETPPAGYRTPALNTDLMEIGKLCLAAVYQVPCASRAKPSSIYLEKYYEPVFNGNQSQVANICKELLYIDNYFRTVYQRKFDRENANEPDSANRISFAHNARTICIAFVALAARYHQSELSTQNIESIFNVARIDNASDSIYEIFHDLGNMRYLLPPSMWANKNLYDAALDKLFSAIIEAGIINYNFACESDSTLTATNYLKRERNYYGILKNHWNSSLKREICATFV